MPSCSRASAAALLALLGGSLVYLTRESDPAVVSWLRHAGLDGAASALQSARHTVHASVHLPAWLAGSASDASFGFALGAVLADAAASVVGVGLLVALGHEIGQGLGVFAGTFDVADLFVLFACFVVAFFAFRPRERVTSPTTPMRIAR